MAAVWKTVAWNEDHSRPIRMDLVRKEGRQEKVLIQLHELSPVAAGEPSNFRADYLGGFGIKEFLIEEQTNWNTVQAIAVAAVTLWLTEKKQAIDAQLAELKED